MLRRQKHVLSQSTTPLRAPYSEGLQTEARPSLEIARQGVWKLEACVFLGEDAPRVSSR